MKNKILNTFLFLAIFLMLPNFAKAADVCMSTTGTKTSGKSTAGDWSSSNCYNNLQAAMAAASGGDTVTIDDGTYSASNNYISQFNYPPSGTASAFTVIRARNIPGQNGIAENQTLKVKFEGNAKFAADNYPGNNASNFVQYVKFWGIGWEGILTYTNWDHLYFKQVASHLKDEGTQGNNASFSINGRYNLLEDCVSYGKGRYKFLFYDISREAQSTGDGNNVCRRCVARNDWARKEGSTVGPIASFSSYFARGSAWLNVIDVDSNLPVYWNNTPEEISGSFYQPVDGDNHRLTVKGSISVNNAYSLMNLRNGSTGHIIDNVVGVKLAGGIGAQGGESMKHIGLYNVDSSQFAYRSSLQTGDNFSTPGSSSALLMSNYGINNWEGLSISVSDIILHNIAGIGTNQVMDYVATNGITGTNFASPAAAPAHLYTGTQSASIKYPVRIESGSPLATAGSGGGPLGPTILNRLGVDGTFKGEPGWDVEQSAPLWPWPLESWIQAEMRTSDYAAFCAPFVSTAEECPPSYSTDAYRGFTALGNDAWEQPITLTSD